MRRHCHVSFALAWSAALLAGCASNKPKPTLQEQSQADLAYYQAQIHKVFKDPVRAEKLVGLAADFQKVMLDRAEAVQSFNAKLVTLNATYSATRAEYETLASQNERDNKLFLQQVVALRAQMASLATDEEWEEIKSARMRGMKDALGGTP